MWLTARGGTQRLTRLQSEAQKKEFETATFAENEVWGIDILISSGEDGKVRVLSLTQSRIIPY